MDFTALAELLFPHIQQTSDEIEAAYGPRELSQEAKVTRMAPSPTGFMHLGNLYGALIDERLAHQSGGVFYLRIEDTDAKRKVENGEEKILEVFDRYGLTFDEGATLGGDNGQYGPYRQSLRGAIYQTYVKELVQKGMAYPCFCTEEELNDMRRQQEANRENFGYYGKYAKFRDCSLEEIKGRIARGESYVIRFRSPGSLDRKVPFTDLVKGKMELTENDQDVVILKSDGIPTYHFAHVVDDHLMGTTHVVRGEEWLATLPIHLQLFQAMGWKPPKYIHTAQLMKMENGSKRKLSKRKDPELALDYYYQAGVPVPAVLEYLMTLLNSNYEEWRMANPQADWKSFPFTTKKMSASGALFDMDKLLDVSKNVISRMTAHEVYRYVEQWTATQDSDFHTLFTADPAYAEAILSIGRGGKKPRKDIALWSDVKPYVSFFFDELFEPDYGAMPANLDRTVVRTILEDYKQIYEETDDADAWFEKLRQMCPRYGFTANMKEYKAAPDQFAGNVGDLSMVLRVAICGRTNSPDLQIVMGLLGRERVLARLEAAKQALA
ncbi:glutamate--tRNA ligase [Bianquea renquensis]|jgi:glutamate--tRNA ligase|uniref:Glutamate--tRNA ligase n=1 Tax=Bianquea renquensis TaxID=2763661 RepID=A0A926DWF9_9FIRM|nr:glutamate--tRNA ligase [Bianquea renquensis]MBC8544914.1 glutamate--tRNA ligase [Bianquea renquensis]